MTIDKIILGIYPRKARLPLSALAGPFIGLAYIIILPFAGFFSLLIFSTHRMMQSISALRHKRVHTIIY